MGGASQWWRELSVVENDFINDHGKGSPWKAPMCLLLLNRPQHDDLQASEFLNSIFQHNLKLTERLQEQYKKFPYTFHPDSPTVNNLPYLLSVILYNTREYARYLFNYLKGVENMTYSPPPNILVFPKDGDIPLI